VRNVAPYWFSAPGKPFRRRSGLPFRTAGRKPSLATTPPTTSRAPSGHEPGDRCRSWNRSRSRGSYRTDPTLPGFHPLQRLRNRGSGPRGLASPATFRPQRFARSRRLTPRDTFPGLFHPGNALEVPPSGTCSSPGGRTSLEAVLLSCRSCPFSAPLNAGRTRGLQSFSLPGESVPRRTEIPLAADSLLALAPLRLSPSPWWGRIALLSSLSGATAKPPSPSSHALRP